MCRAAAHINLKVKKVAPCEGGIEIPCRSRFPLLHLQSLRAGEHGFEMPDLSENTFMLFTTKKLGWHESECRLVCDLKEEKICYS